jgi:hypothetical protein
MKMENRFNNQTAYRTKPGHGIILLLCIAAACRVFVFNAAFPLFNNVDEELHFDLVYKYSKGHVPKAEVQDFDREAVELILLYKTPEYLFKAEQFSGGLFPQPRWMRPNERESKQFAEAVAKWLNINKNCETGSFPVYYILAGIWCNVGRALGVTGGQLLYWIRFLNVPLCTVLVWLSYRLAQVCFPEKALQQIAIPLIVAFFPQDMFYSINCDALSSLLFAISFLLLLQIYFESKSYFCHFSAGAAVAATMLTKISNIAVFALLGAIVILKVRKLIGEKKLKEYLPQLGILLAAAVIPVGIWLIRNYIVFGDLTGTTDKIKLLRWTAMPLNKLFDHPILTPGGIFYFLSELTKTFWRGEFVWHLKPIAWRSTDLFYAASSAALTIVCGLGVILNRNKVNQRYRLVLVMSFLVVGVSVLLLAVLSMLYDFNDCIYPSQNKPYFVSGRLISCAMLPFLLIYIDGLERTFRRLGERATLLIIMAIVIGITLSEFWLTAEVFTSPYNWFSLR